MYILRLPYYIVGIAQLWNNIITGTSHKWSTGKSEHPLYILFVVLHAVLFTCSKQVKNKS